MYSDKFLRTELLLGKTAMEKLKKSRVAVFGIGGVGGFAVEALARAGIGAIDIFDGDVIDETNINRQIFALISTVGKSKVDVAYDRIRDINDEIKINKKRIFFTKENEREIDFTSYDYIIDAIDTISSKVTLIENANMYGVPIISAMGAGNKVDPTRFKVSDIYKTEVCPLAKKMRLELKKIGIKSLKVVYSTENPISRENAIYSDEKSNETMINSGFSKKKIVGSISFVPPVVGFIIASEVIKDLIKEKG